MSSQTLPLRKKSIVYVTKVGISNDIAVGLFTHQRLFRIFISKTEFEIERFS